MAESYQHLRRFVIGLGVIGAALFAIMFGVFIITVFGAEMAAAFGLSSAFHGALIGSSIVAAVCLVAYGIGYAILRSEDRGSSASQ